MKKNFYLVGKNISLSLSPKIHNEIFLIFGLNCNYSLMPLNSASEILNLSFEKLNIGGLNVTAPFKSEIAKKIQDFSSCNSVNTIIKEENELNGYSTDGEGFILDANRLNLDISRVLILGFGGVAQSIIHSLKQKNSQIHVISRKYNTFNADFNDLILNLERITNENKITLTINCTGADLPIFNTHYDLRYNIAHPLNGIGMLIYQAILSEQIFQNKSLDLSIFNQILAKIKG